ncbi:DUF2510 domain-containing protein [Clavibacter nebraskensis]|uniref:DUF2510 domain-containing protein n=1 Tax=Clavibacter nebraskensis TaxID=31963 RepID=A0ABY4MPK1_9MICO|nr:DUF2510 domain-containing protein [Clavibacter nebraskensis]QGV70177.2 DUF2510 domain-containing protein [Clavibacter nebraskensis]QGV72968.2 DUF2510 domain-containing protein [Clavibacter nebraskensis]UQB04445.1 DUF2510 domain-containing protein [Clavibacter nebraskensis]UQB10098.1 DUF2510 domain-containing protein [Clavibacter nebraskensis]
MTATAPAWFPDQSDPDLEAYWDGSKWTGERRSVQRGTTSSAVPIAHDADALLPPEGQREAVHDPAPARPSTGAWVFLPSALAFVRSVRGKWISGGIAFLLISVAVGIPLVVGGIETQQREQAIAREEQARAARLANDARSDALVSRDETLTTAREFLLTDLSYAPEDTTADLAKAVKELEDVSVTNTDAINSAVMRVKNGMTNVGKPYTWSMSCTDAAYKSHEFADFRTVWASTLPLSRCEAGTKSGTFYTEAQRAVLSSGAITSLDGNGTLQSICASLGFGSYANMATYSASQAKELMGALTICPDHPNAADVRARVDSSLAEEAALAEGRAFGAGVKRIGQDVQPGTYVTEGELDGCYWERTDAAGEIIDNNFISSGLRAEVVIRSGDYSFTSTSCGTWRKQ